MNVTLQSCRRKIFAACVFLALVAGCPPDDSAYARRVAVMDAKYRALRVERDFAFETARRLENLGYTRLKVAIESEGGGPEAEAAASAEELEEDETVRNADGVPVRRSQISYTVKGRRIGTFAPVHLVAAGFIDSTSAPGVYPSRDGLCLVFSGPVMLGGDALRAFLVRIDGQVFAAEQVFACVGTYRTETPTYVVLLPLRPVIAVEKIRRSEILIVPGAFQAERPVRGAARLNVTP